MKDKGISRDVGGRRKAGDAPNLGQVGRMSHPQQPGSGGGGRRRRRTVEPGRSGGSSKQSNESRATTFRWTIVLGVLALIVIAGGVFFWLKPLLDRRDKLAAATPHAPKLAPMSSLPPFGEQEAVTLTKRALNARTEAEVNDNIRSGESQSLEVLSYLKSLKETEGEIQRYDWLARLDTTRPDMEGVLVTFKKEGKVTNRLALLSPDPKTQVWKMDYPAFVREASPAWSELTEGRAQSAVVRVYIAQDQYFNGPFVEAQGWRCFGIASPDLPELLFGYCQVGTPQELAIRNSLSNRPKLRMTLEIERKEGASPRQFLIKRVLAQDWAIGGKPFDEE